MALKIVLLGIYHESNTFVNELTTLSDFKEGHYLKGVDIKKEYEKAHHEIGGMLEVLDHQQDVEIIPIMLAEATPGGIISSETYSFLLKEMMSELDKILPVDGCLVVPHGAAVSETFVDMDGHWLSQLRDKIGAKIPIVGTLDLHANVSQLMVSSTNALVSYKQNPHIDQRQRGKEAAELMIHLLLEEIEPLQVLVQIPVAISIEQQFTDNEPCKSLYNYASELEKQKDILSVSIQLGFPYADVREMGTSVIVVSNNNRDLALSTCKQLESYIIDNKDNFIGDKKDISHSLSLLKESEKPVLMLDMGDNVGGGGPGNNITLMKVLEQQEEYQYFINIYDPQAVLQAEKYREKDQFDISIIGTIKNKKKLFKAKVTLNQLTDGKFKESNPRHGGQFNYNMGKTAIVSTEKGNIIMLTSLRIPPFSLQQLTSFNIDPKDFDVIVAKGVNAPIAAYSPVCPTIIQVNTPGVTQADMTMFNYSNRRKPLFPFEDL